MKRIKILKNTLAIILISSLLFGLCSCKSKKEDKTSSQTESTTVTTTVATSLDENTETQQDQSTTLTQQQSDLITSATQLVPDTTDSQQQLPTQTEPITEPVVTTGTETITDSNKTIVFPAALRNSSNKYPVISWANGTGCPTQLYMKLIGDIANAGYIVIADSTVMSGDGAAQIDSINYIINKNGDSSSVFYKKVDTVNIGVCGQSQGGRSCINAAQKDSRIRAVVSIAGASTADEAKGIKIPCLFLTATNDNIVKSGDWCLPSYNAVAGRAAYASLVGGNHLSFNNMSGYVIDWFNAYLKNDANAKAVFTDGGKLANDKAWQDFRNKN